MLVAKAPVFLSFVKACVPKRNAEKAKPVLCMCSAILLKYRNNKMSLVQCIISLILQAGHCGNQVSICSVVCCEQVAKTDAVHECKVNLKCC